MAKVANVAKEGKKEFTMQQVFALWKKESKAGNTYFEGKFDGVSLRGFFNTKKKNPNEPDLRVYTVNEEGELNKDELTCLWCNATENGKKYLSGKLDEKRIVGFINASANTENKQPYISVYYSDDNKVSKKNEKEQPSSVDPF